MQGTILTDIGSQKIASATPEQQLSVTHVAVGDGNGGYPPLTPSMTSLTNEVWRGSASAPIRKDDDPTQLIFEVVIPASEGGFTIREIAIFDSEGDMIAIGQTNAIEKPDGTTVVGFTLTARLFIKLASAEQVNVILSDTGVTDHQGLSNRSAIGAHPAFSITVDALPALGVLEGQSVQEALAAIVQATEEKQGLVEKATNQEAVEGAQDKFPDAAAVLLSIQSNAKKSIALSGFKLKENPELPIFIFDGSSLKTQQKFTLFINDELMTFNENENVQVPALSAASDYKIYALADGSITSQAWASPEPSDSILVGGFHAAYSNSAIVERSIWDFGWRPKCNPRAMVLSLSNRVWADIYLMDTAYGLNGYSRPNAQIADGGSLPIRPLVYGGNGVSTYTSFTRYVANELAASAGKRLPSMADFEDIAYGTVTGQAAGTDPATTKYQAGLRSAIGCEQVTGAMWQWGIETWDRGNGTTGYAWYAADTDNEGQVYSAGSQAVGAVVFGAYWVDSGSAGARTSSWLVEPWYSNDDMGARGLCDHTIGGF